MNLNNSISSVPFTIGKVSGSFPGFVNASLDNIEFWNNWLEIYQLRELSAISLGQAYYVYEDIDTYDNSLFSESNYYLEQAVSLVGKKAWNSC